MIAKISVIIPAFNAQNWIRSAIQSVVGQGVDNMEIIVVDDGSTDRAAEIVEKEFPSVQLVKIKNGGPSIARNFGTNLSKGEFIQYLDADDLLAPDKLKVQLEMLKTSGADIAYGDWQKLIRNKEGIFENGGTVTRKLQNPEIDLFTDFWCPPAAYMFRRSIVEKIGGWKEDLPVIQDARFALDCALYGGKFIHCSGIMAYYRVQSSNSVSTNSSTAFVRDCFRNATEIEAWWQGHGGINNIRRKGLIKVYGYTARASFEKDKNTFENAYQALERLNPNYIPESPGHLKAVSRMFGYRNAERIASWYRKTLKP